MGHFKVFHSRPFQVIDSTNMVMLDNDVIYGESLQVAFQIVEKQRVCDRPFDVYKTTNGLYLTISISTKILVESKKLSFIKN